MKTFIIYAVLIAFFAGALASSAFAFGCPNMAKGAVTAGMTMDSDSSLPCHEQNSSQKSCEGLCLCLDLSINQIQLLNEPFVIAAPKIIAQNHGLATEQPLVSLQASPLLKPPILLS